ncbi:uncharacterized protein LOC141897071 [Acropora palmata]|uniref:uncharacterized protein LOC141897071 n=1 Tax=Acropora palmata TaxID=6131 RepID=UPI003DA1ACC8
MARRYSYVINLVSARFILPMLIIFGALLRETCQKPFKVTSEDCRRECDAISADHTKAKVSTVFSSCYLRCLKKAKGRQSLMKAPLPLKRMRRGTQANNDCLAPWPNQTEDWCPPETNVSFGQYENTTDWYIDVSWTPLNDKNGMWSGLLIRFYPEPSGGFSVDDLICFEARKNQTFMRINISSFGYIYPNKIFLKVRAFPFSLVQESIDSYSPTAPPTPAPFKTTKSLPVRIEVAVSISIGILVGLALVTGLIKYYACRKKRLSLPEEFEYHAFIIYSQKDELWLTKKILPLLEERNELKCCIHYRDFEPGKLFHQAMADCVYKSHKVIAVISRSFFASNYCNYELNIAKYRLLNARDDCLIMIRIDDVGRDKIPRKLQKRNYIDYNSAVERPFWEEKLLKFLQAPCADHLATTSND